MRALTHHKRTPRADLALALLLAALAGAVNAGGFLAIGQYTSHLTGMVATTADTLVLHQWGVMAFAMLGVGAFIGGTVLAALFVNWGARHRPHHRYALPLAGEGVLIIVFGLYGMFMPAHWQMPACGIMLLGMLMGLQNATGMLITNLRTTHHTGTLNDIGMDLGHLLYRYLPHRSTTHNVPLPVVNLRRLKVNMGMITCFFGGAVTGAFGFQVLGMGFALPIGSILLALTVPILIHAPEEET